MPGLSRDMALRLEQDRTPCAGITQIRFEGLRPANAGRTLSAVRSPVGYSVVSGAARKSAARTRTANAISPGPDQAVAGGAV